MMSQTCRRPETTKITLVGAAVPWPPQLPALEYFHGGGDVRTGFSVVIEPGTNVTLGVRKICNRSSRLSFAVRTSE